MNLSSTMNLLFAGAALLASTPSADAAERKLRGRQRNTKGAVSNDSSVMQFSSDGEEAQRRRKLGESVVSSCSGVCARPAECPANLHTLTLPACSNAAIGELCEGDGKSKGSLCAGLELADGIVLAWDGLDNCSYQEYGTGASLEERWEDTATVYRSVYVRSDCNFLFERPSLLDKVKSTPPPTPPPTEPFWEAGTLCGAGTTCENNCKDGVYEYWDSLLFTACGREPCWEDSTVCAAGTTCNNCCSNSYHWSLEHFFTVCGV